MSISAISAGSTSQMSGSNQMAQMKQNIDDLGSALSSGNLDDAKKAFAKLQKNAPSGGDGKSPSEIDDLKKALVSGDLKGAQEAYSKIQEKMSQGPPAGGKASAGGKPPAGGNPPAGGRPPAGGKPPQEAQGDTVQLSSQAKTSSTENKTYDKKDSNKDGTVSVQEELLYDLSHPNSESTTAVEKTDTKQEESGVEAYA